MRVCCYSMWCVHLHPVQHGRDQLRSAGLYWSCCQSMVTYNASLFTSHVSLVLSLSLSLFLSFSLSLCVLVVVSTGGDARASHPREPNAMWTHSYPGARTAGEYACYAHYGRRVVCSHAVPFINTFSDERCYFLPTTHNKLCCGAGLFTFRPTL